MIMILIHGIGIPDELKAAAIFAAYLSLSIKQMIDGRLFTSNQANPIYLLAGQRGRPAVYFVGSMIGQHAWLKEYWSSSCRAETAELQYSEEVETPMSFSMTDYKR